MFHGHDILVVNDCPLDAQETLIALEQVASPARVLHVESGADALEYLFSVGAYAGRRPGRPRLVLLSLEMSTMGGLCVLDLMRAHPLTRSIPVALLSLEPNVRKHRRHDRFDADAYIAKPCDFHRYCAVLAGYVKHWLPSAAHRRRAWHRLPASPRAEPLAASL